ncbi:MAG: beta-N-acetylhexosaminidase [Muribaculaceae bacterium]|nr:beta-N-acetylhexosaminidase [Muribaculaceae bacterium]
MKSNLLSIAVGIIALCAPAGASGEAPFVNLTPQPKEISLGSGSLTLPSEFAVDSSSLPAEMKAEVDKFAAAMARAGFTVSQSPDAALMTISVNDGCPAEGYNLSVTASKVTVEAATPAGLFYAFQTIRKILPAHVMAELPANGSFAYELPLMEIIDGPRYAHRGLEIDSARHFWTVTQMKKMIDVMSYYKMNRLHWHLTDDQGWRIEIPKYPKLSVEAATAPNAYWWDFDNGYEYYLNEPYGPYCYSVDDLKEVVAYAKERHIEVIPEVDMPGHMEAAIAAYPEFSTNPEGQYQVRYWPGVSSNILDISNPKVMQFCKDVIDELVEIFPFEYIHIGGDECPKSAWKNSASIQKLMTDLGISTEDALQSWFSKQIADYAKPKGRKLICWNEVLNGDPEMVKDADIMIYDWLGGTRADGPSYQAATLGLRSVWCSTYHYYIDYSQWGGSNEPKSMAGPITLETIYNVKPSTAPADQPDLLPYYYGVQCNLWCEYVAEPKHLEYNALPRTIAVAETGWSPDAKKNFADFRKRFNADTELLDLRGYTYGKHYVDVKYTDPEQGRYATLITCANADAGRRGRCIELVRDGSPLINEKNARAGKLWTAMPAAENNDAYNWQQWTFEADPAGSGKFALVCKAQPQGSVSPDMEGSGISAHWAYDTSTKHYNFVVGEHFAQSGANFTYSIRSDKNSSWWMNCAQTAQNNTVNNWSNPADGDGGIWLYNLVDETVDQVSPAPGQYGALVTCASHDSGRAGRCMELVRDGSPLIAQKQASVGKIWTNTQFTEYEPYYDWQQWTFEADPAGSGKYALVCKARPQGSVSPDMEGSSVGARWNYDNNTKHYNFVVGEHMLKQEGNYAYSIRSDKNSSWWMNCAQTAQDNAVNNWSNPADGNGGIWLFSFERNDIVYPEFNFLEEGEAYIFTAGSGNTAGAILADNASGNFLGHTETDPAETGTAAVWIVEATRINAETNIQFVTLRNAKTGRYISGGADVAVTSTPSAGFFTGDAGYPVEMSAAKPAEPNVRIMGWEGYDDLKIQVKKRNIYPLSANSMVNPSTISSGSTTAGNAVRNQGAAWIATKASEMSISEVALPADAAGTGIYDIQGRRLSRITAPGLYIIDGRKQLVR